MLGHIVNAPALGHGGLGLDHEHPPRGEGICGRGLGEEGEGDGDEEGDKEEEGRRK